jgi:hypothetical protein
MGVQGTNVKGSGAAKPQIGQNTNTPNPVPIVPNIGPQGPYYKQPGANATTGKKKKS